MPLQGVRALDLATGTGDIAWELVARGARVTALDITPRMIELARGKAAGRPVKFLVGDMNALPFPDNSFDLVTTGYGLRNVPNLEGAIAELFRVLRPGGRGLSLDFNKPSNRIVCALYLMYLTFVGSILGWALHRDPDTYRYIPASLRRYPASQGVVRMMEGHGFVSVVHVPVLGGLMSIHRAVRS